VRFIGIGLIALALGVGGPTGAQAQATGVIRGVLLTTGERQPVEGARISLVGTTIATRTSRTGGFEFTGLEAGRYLIRVAAIGFATVTTPLDLKAGQTMDLEFNTEAEPVNLPEVTVEGENTNGPMDWLRRKSEGRGRYIDRAEIERRQAATLPDAMRMVPGVRIDCRGLRCLVRMTRAPRGCNPAFFMDGIPSDPAIAWLTPIEEVEGIEVYSGPAQTPPELESFQARCGVVVIWTRTPPPRRPKNKPTPPPPDTTSGASSHWKAEVDGARPGAARETE